MAINDFTPSIFNALLKLNISSASPINKCLPLTKIAYFLALLTNDEKAKKIFENELKGYDGKVPEYRYIENAPVKLSLVEIVDIFNKEMNNLDAHTKIGKNVIRLRKLNSLLESYDLFVYNYVAKIIQQSGKKPTIPIELNIQEIPEEIKEFLTTE